MNIDSLLVIGAGPAGYAAAISARAFGIPVMLVESRRINRQLPGETLHPGVEPILRQLGVWDAVAMSGFHRHTGIWRVDLDGERTFESYGHDSRGEWQGFQVNRVEFNQILRDQAIKMGASLIEMSDLLRASHDNSGWALDFCSGQRINSSILMDATGRRAWLASQLGLTAERSSETQRVRFGWTDVEPGMQDQNPVFHLQMDGWNWTAPVGQGREAWVRMHRGGGTAGLDLTPRIYRKCAGLDWFLLGDAACLTSPASGNGVLRALMSGIYAIHCIATMREGTVSPHLVVEAYCSWVNEFWESSIQGAKLFAS